MSQPVQIPYRRLPGRTATFRYGAANSPVSSLWLGPDHLLKVERTTSRESYKRFYYADIQSIFLEESSRRTTLAIISGLIVAVRLLPFFVYLMTQRFDGFMVFCAFVALPFLLGLIVNLAMGRTCDAVLVTAVGTERLSSLCRLPKAIRALGEITAEVEKAQGSLQFAQLAAKWPGPVWTPPVN